MSRISLCCIILLLIPYLVIAEPSSNAPAKTAAVKPKHITLYCPDVSQLVLDKQKHTWSANKHSWKSYDLSFAAHANSFVGGQWIGASIGRIACYYSSTDSLDFPIVLVFHGLIFQPKPTQHWALDPHTGYWNCKNVDRETRHIKLSDTVAPVGIYACPFFPQLKQKKGPGLYQEAEDLRNKEFQKQDAQ